MGVTSAGIAVPTLFAGLPCHVVSWARRRRARRTRMMHSDTPWIGSRRALKDALKRWSVVFSNDASMSTESFILATPKRVIPSTSP